MEAMTMTLKNDIIAACAAIGSEAIFDIDTFVQDTIALGGDSVHFDEDENCYVVRTLNGTVVGAFYQTTVGNYIDANLVGE
jgi:hypothetical protein